MKLTVERYFNNIKHTYLGAGYYTFYEDVFNDLLYGMRDKIGHPFIGEEYHNLRFVMNIPFYNQFCITCKVTGHDSDMYRGIKIISDPTMYVGDSAYPDGIVELVYEEEPELKKLYEKYCVEDAKASYQYWRNFLRSSSAAPHIDHVKFNGPATIVFWKDGTKTVVKYDGKGLADKRQAILYAFIRKIYGEGKPYHNILNEIEEALLNEH